MNGFLLIIPAVLLWLSPLAASEIPDSETLAKLIEGEVILRDVDTDRAGGSVRVLILVHATARSFWDVIVSCELAFAFVDGLQECEVLEDSGDRALVHQIVKKGWPVPTQDFVFESLRDPYREIGFKLVDGNLKAMEGGWRFTETADGLLLDYELHVEPGVPAPRFLVRRNVRKGMPDMLACMRGLSGGSGSAEQRQKDLKRCPGDPPPSAQ